MPPLHFLLLLLLATSCLFNTAHAQLPNMNLEDIENLLGDNLFGNYKKDHICPTYSCPSGYTPIAKWPLKIESTGCAAAMGGDSGRDYKHIQHCCHTKNACYQLCGSDKQKCDAVFGTCMEKSCKELPDSSKEELEDMSEEEIEKEREECDSTTKLMILLGEMAGCGAYDAHQHIHCQCVEKGKVEENMERVLRAFYEEYNPDAVDKVKGLIEKTRGKKRSVFNKILMSLVNHYPAALTKTEPEPEMPDPIKEDL